MTAKSYHGSRTRATTWVPRRVFYVLRHLQRTLTPGKAQPISNKQIKDAIRFGSEGEVSQIMRWLSGDQPTMGRWAYGCLDANPQQYRFITRERMPSGGYLVTLLATPERIERAAVRLPEIVQLSFFGDANDPPMIPRAPRSDAVQGGSFSHDPFDGADPRQHSAAKRRHMGDQHEDRSHESNSSSVGVSLQKYDWSGVATEGIDFLPIAALERAGVTPDIFQAAERKIVTRCEYDRQAQVRILIHSLLTNQPIYSVSEIAARTEEHRHDTAAAPTGRDGAGARRSSRTHSTRRSALQPEPNEERDAEFAAQLTEFDRIARERGILPSV